MLFMLHGNDVDAVHAAQVQVLDAVSDQLPRRHNAPHLHVVAQRDVVQHIAVDQPLADAHRHIGLGVNDIRAQLLQHLAVYVAGGLGDDVRHAQLQHLHRGHNAHVHALTDADGHGAAVVHTGFAQRLLGQCAHHKGVVGVAAHRLDLFLVLINGDDLLAGGCQRLDQRRAETPQTDDAVGLGRNLLFHFRYLVLSQW